MLLYACDEIVVIGPRPSPPVHARKTDDILTGTFEGILRSSTGGTIPVTEGEFKIKIFRKDMSCDK